MSVEVSVRTLDGTRLSGTFTTPEEPRRAVLMVHGAGVTRDEVGLYPLLAEALAAAGVASLRLDLPGHGTSGGRRADLTLSGLLNALDAATAKVAALTGLARTGIVAASLSGGVSAYFAAHREEIVDRLVLLYPLLDYRRRFVFGKPWWTGTEVTGEAAETLDRQGHVEHTPVFPLGRAMLNEVFWLRPDEVFRDLVAPTMLIHGSADPTIPLASSEKAAADLTAEHELVVLDGAGHGFSPAGDSPAEVAKSREWTAAAVAVATRWLTPPRP
ncbi:alpha/beta hydrolase [Actinophytocola glycyrrhizae]|uniref:Alpha/beta hydrolase n=1 Tax=Actinophytocola glycyrrhizae TaxID=2044873 RepID=A0ABV9S8E1_9PSEU